MHAAGVQRQFSLETARYENCQIGILLFYQAQDGSLLLLDRDLYVPQSWIDDPVRCRRASMPAGMSYRSKSEIAVNLVNRAVSAGVLPEWTLLSLLCTDKGAARKSLQQAGLPHVMTLTPGESAAAGRLSGSQVHTVSQETFAAQPALAKQVAGGPAVTERTREFGRSVPVRLRRTTLAATPVPGFEVSYLTDSVALRGTGRTAAHYYAYTGREVTNHNLAAVVSNLKGLMAGSCRFRDDVGIARYEVRSWRGWYRHITLAMVASAAHALSKTDSSDCWAS
jgi:hypothetical protein